MIFYGTGCDAKTAWLPWLKNELNKRKIDCLIPKLPTPKNQTFINWAKLINSIKIDEQDCVIGWSTGAIFAVRYLYEKNIHIKKLVLVSGFNNYKGTVPEVDKINKDFFMKDLSIASKVADEIICIKSDNDPFITQEALTNFAIQLNAKIINIEAGGHFNFAAGYDKFPKLLETLL